MHSEENRAPSQAAGEATAAADTVVLFDDTCALCRTLAAYAARRAPVGALRFVSWQSFRSSNEGASRLDEDSRQLAADRLRVLAGAQLLTGDEAWGYLISRHPDFKALNWLAERTGLHHQVARIVQGTGAFTRLLCSRCRR